MSENPQVANSPEAIDVEQVLKRNYIIFTKLLGVRVAVIAALVATPMGLHKLGVPDSFFLALPFVAAMGVFILTVYRVRCGVRLVQCARVLRHYPLEFRTRVDKKSESWTEYGNVFTIRVSTRGQHGAPLMWAINAAGRRRWPEGTENGAWVAGDLPFGGVMVVPGSNAMLFMNPADWAKLAPKREQADAERIAMARQARLAERNWKKPMMWRGG
ncbi:hypothetical protein ABZW18_28755 [Streptomyces sp. NPDC004647]|uniref:hypothetical protein n=1 Tax=Streptomyces sp. NPDC004647 TaxID=3154671 RepID=UPI00339FB640